MFVIRTTTFCWKLQNRKYIRLTRNKVRTNEWTNELEYVCELHSLLPFTVSARRTLLDQLRVHAFPSAAQWNEWVMCNGRCDRPNAMCSCVWESVSCELWSTKMNGVWGEVIQSVVQTTSEKLNRQMKRKFVQLLRWRQIELNVDGTLISIDVH